MKTKFILTLAVLVVVFAATFFVLDLQIAQAQSGCTDATGAPIDCPTTDDNTGDTGNDTGGGNNDDPRPTKTSIPLPAATFTPTPTVPAIDITPMDDISSGESSLTQTVTPFVPSATPVTIQNPNDEPGSTEYKSTTCSKHPSGWHFECAMKWTGVCLKNGGEASSSADTHGNIKVTCSKDVFGELPDEQLAFEVL